MSIRHSSRERLLGAIRVKNPDFVFDSSDVSYGLPIVLDPLVHGSGRNTQVLVTATESSTRYILSQDVFYNRNDLAVLFTDVTDIGAVADHSTETIIAHLNEWLGLAFQSDDIEVIDYVAATGNTPASVTLFALEGSLGFIGSKTVTLTISKTPLAVAIANNILDGLTYPPVHIAEPDAIVVNATLSPNSTNPTTGYIYVGSGNSAENWFSSSSDTLELAIALRRWKSNDALPLVNDVVQLGLDDDSDWSIGLSVAMQGEGSGARPTDHFDIEWKVTNLDTQESMVWALRDSIINSGNIDWVCTSMALPNPNGGTITDNAYNGLTKSVVQNIQRVTFYPNAFPTTERLSTAPFGTIGTFEVSLSARVKDAISTLQETKATIYVFRNPV